MPLSYAVGCTTSARDRYLIIIPGTLYRGWHRVSSQYSCLCNTQQWCKNFPYHGLSECSRQTGRKRVHVGLCRAHVSMLLLLLFQCGRRIRKLDAHQQAFWNQSATRKTFHLPLNYQLFEIMLPSLHWPRVDGLNKNFFGLLVTLRDYFDC